MGRRPNGWYRDQFNDRRRQQEQRPIAAAPDSTVLADEYLAPTTAPPLSSSMSTSLLSRSRGATTGPSRGSRARSNRSNRSSIDRIRPNENLCMRIRRPDGNEAVARAVIVDHMRNIVISEEFITDNGIFSIQLREERRRYIAEGSDLTGILHAQSSADITILHPSRDPNQTVVRRALVFRPESQGQISHDVRVPRSMRHLCAPIVQNFFGLDVTTFTEQEDFNSVLGSQQHTSVLGTAASRARFDHARFDHSMLAAGIVLGYQPGQYDLPLGEHGPTPAAYDSSSTVSYQPQLGADNSQWYYGVQPPTYQQSWNYVQGSDGMQSANQWPSDDGTPLASHQSWDDGQGDDGQGDDGQEDDGEGDDGQWFGDPPFNT